MPLKTNGVQKHTFTVLSLDPLTILCMSTSVHVMAPVKNNHANIEKAKPPKSAVGFNAKIVREFSFPSYACVVDCGQV